MKGKIKVPISEAVRTVTITLTGRRLWEVRRFIGFNVIRLGIWIMGAGREVKAVEIDAHGSEYSEFDIQQAVYQGAKQAIRTLRLNGLI